MKRILTTLFAVIIGILIGIIGAMIVEELFEEEEEGTTLEEFIGQPYQVTIIPSNFVEGINHTFFPLSKGTRWVYEGTTDEGLEQTEVMVENYSKTVMGVKCTVVRDTVKLNGNVMEDTYDWFAQDRFGNVWYFGEDSKEMEDGEIVSTSGSWEGGIDGALPGIIMLANPISGMTYRQEYYKGEAEDIGTVVKVDETVQIEFGSYQKCLKTYEWTPLEPDAGEYKYYAPGVGCIMETSLSGSEKIELKELILSKGE